MSPDDQEQRYTDREVRAIFARLSELQAQQVSASTGAGTTFRQLQVATSELGLDSELLQQAVDEMSGRPEMDRGSFVFGGPWRMSSDKIVPGGLDAEAWPAFVQDMRARTGRVGTPKNSGSLFEWSSSNPDPLHVAVSPSGENTRITISASFGAVPGFMQFMGGFVGFMFGAIIGSSLESSVGHSLHGSLTIIASLLISTALGFVVGRVAGIPVGRRKMKLTRDFIAFAERRATKQMVLASSLDQRLSDPVVDPADVRVETLS